MPSLVPENMRFVDVTGPGGPEVLAIRKMPTPAPRENEVLIKVQAAGVNPTYCSAKVSIPRPQARPPFSGSRWQASWRQRARAQRSKWAIRSVLSSPAAATPNTA